MGRKSGTSIPEQAIYYYVRRLFPDAENRYKFRTSNGKKYEVDIYIPSAKTAIEYDGAYWHQKRLLLEEEKNRYLANNDIFLIRVRESGLSDLALDNGIVLIHKDKKSAGLHMNEIITEIIHIVAKHSSKQASMLIDFTLSFDEYCKDYPDILNSIYGGIEDPNVTSSCTYPCWDIEKNAAIDPHIIPANATAKLWYKCPNGNVFRYSVRDCNYSSKCDKKCEICAFTICPFINYCPPYCDYSTGYPVITERCSYIKQYVFDYIKGAHPWPEKYGSQLTMAITINDEALTLDLLRMLDDPCTSQDEKGRIVYMLGDRYDQDNDGYPENGVDLENVILRVWEANSEQDLITLRHIVEKYDWFFLLNFTYFQDTKEKQSALCAYLDWLLKHWKDKPEKTARFLSLMRLPRVNVNLPKGFKKKLYRVFDSHNVDGYIEIFE